VTRAAAGERLAIEGGEPVRRDLLPYAHHLIDETDVAAVVAALRSEWLTTGPRVGEFEAALAAATRARHAVCFSSGTAALHGAMAVAGLGRGDEAVTTPMTFVATANAVRFVGAEPVFADVDPDSLLLDPARTAEAVSSRTRAIVAVDYAGQPADYAGLRAAADRAPRGSVLVADASHSLGGSRDGVPVGRLADLTVLSLHPAKMLTTGEGGAVLTERDDWAAALRRFRNHGIDTERAVRRDWTYAMVELGYNYRLTDIGAALGRAQLERLPRFLSRRRALADRYLAAFADEPALQLPGLEPGAEHAWHFFWVQLRPEALRVDRAAVYHALRAEGIGVNVHYIPVHRHPYYAQRLPGLSLPAAEAAYERLLTLPLFPGMSDADADDVVAAVGKVLRTYAT
jgi:perosamine synthetase